MGEKRINKAVRKSAKPATKVTKRQAKGKKAKVTSTRAPPSTFADDKAPNQPGNPSMEAAIKTFFSSPRFAVAGASSDPRKFGHKVFAWYLAHNLPVTPLNPTCPSITVPLHRPSSTDNNNEYHTTPNPTALPSPSQFSLSVITPPSVTRQLLQEAKDVGVRAVWLQPGSFDKEGLAFARQEWPEATIAGTDVPGSRGGEGWCVLVDGDWGLGVAGRTRRDEKL